MKTIISMRKNLLSTFLILCLIHLNFIAKGQTSWLLGGNTPTTTQFVGSTGAQDLIFKTNGTEYMRLIGVATNRGNLGIGTNNPGANLAVAGKRVVFGGNQMNGGYGASDMAQELQASGSCFFSMISGFGGTSNNVSLVSTTSFGEIVVGNSSNPFLFWVGAAERVRIASSGNVGIGTSTPANKLDLEGALVVGATYSGTNTAPANGLLVEGGVGIGLTSIPSGGPSGGYKFAVSGNTNIMGNLVIGTTANFTSPTPFPSPYKLFVEGGILTEKLKVSPKTTSDWSDYVFNKNYNLMPLAEVEKYIFDHKHLPNVPSAEEVVANGIDVAKMDAKLLEKIEELTLYMIQQQKQIETQQKQIETQQKQIEELKIIITK